MDREKELLKLTRQAIKVAEQVPKTKTESLKNSKVGAVVTLSSPDAQEFSQNLFGHITEMERQGITEVDIQYSTSIVNNIPTGPTLVHAALVVGRKHADASIK